MGISDDYLSTCLIWLAAANGVTISQDALVDGLPLVDGRLSPSLFARAAERANMKAKLVRQPLTHLNRLLFPCVVLLEGNRACLLQSIDSEKQTVRVLLPELDMQPEVLDLASFKESYTGRALYCRPQFKLDQTKTANNKAVNNEHWFWRVIKESRPVYRDILIAAFFINLFALTMPLFVMNVYDRVVPNHATDTLWVLALGVLIIICADLALRIMRSWFVELAASRADITLSAQIMERILGTRLEKAPQSFHDYNRLD